MTSSGPILVVEDVPHVRDLLVMTLRFQGYEVLAAANGAEALEKVAQRPPVLVVTDILMPRLDGYALAYRLRSDPQTRSIPIIFISATYVTPEDKAFAQQLGAAEFIEKPIDTDEFLLTVAEILAAQEKHALPPLDEKAFYQGHKERLQAKLAQKNRQISRLERLLPTLPEPQRDAYKAMLQEALTHRQAIREELAEIEAHLQALAASEPEDASSSEG